MTTVAQVKQVIQPLLQRNPDLALVGRLVFIKPVHHILRGVFVDRSLDPKSFVPTWSANFLFQPNAHFHFFWGTRMQGIWDIGVPDLAEKMAEAIERDALPPLRSIITIDDFVRFTHDAWLEDEKPYVDVARSDFAAAQSMCNFFASLNGTTAFDRRSASVSSANSARSLPQMIDLLSRGCCTNMRRNRSKG